MRLVNSLPSGDVLAVLDPARSGVVRRFVDPENPNTPGAPVVEVWQSGHGYIAELRRVGPDGSSTIPWEAA